MINFSNKGIVSISGTVIAECDTRSRKLINFMKFFNASKYSLTVEIYDAYTTTTITTTSVALLGGDHLIEDNSFYLEPGDKITVTCDVPGTSFSISGEEVDLKKR